VCGAVATGVPERPLPGTDVMRPVDADDTTAFIMRFAVGALGSVQICYTAAHDVGEEIVVTGSEGTLAIQEDGPLLGAKRGERIRELLRPDRDRAAGSARHITPFSILAGEWVLAMRTGTEANPSFEDGVKVQEVLDAVTSSQRLSRWIDLSGTKWPV
jgi:predicted dehydrogenase